MMLLGEIVSSWVKLSTEYCDLIKFWILFHHMEIDSGKMEYVSHSNANYSIVIQFVTTFCRLFYFNQDWPLAYM